MSGCDRGRLLRNKTFIISLQPAAVCVDNAQKRERLWLVVKLGLSSRAIQRKIKSILASGKMNNVSWID